MKTLFLLPFIIFSLAANATNYYFSVTGNDANNGTSTSTPWQTVSKFNSVSGYTQKNPGDSLLFKRGDTFYGSLRIGSSGSSGSPIVIGAYGTGSKPVITGFTTVSAWTNLGSNIWESTAAVSTLATCNMVTINGVNTPMGRYPNTGWITYQSASGNTSITSSSLTGTPNWTGAQAVIRKDNNWIIDPVTITSKSGGTLNYSNSSSYAGGAGNGFFIQNDVRTLDAQNEWYYNPSTKKLRIYSTSTPTGVQVANLDTLVTVIYSANYIILDNLNIVGANYKAVSIDGTTTIQNCDIDFSGNFGIKSPNGSYATVSINNNTVNHCNNSSIEYTGRYPVSITNNTVKNSGMIVGASPGGDGSCNAIWTDLQDPLVNISYNRVDSCGFIGIVFATGKVHHNYITNFNFIKQDGGAIYTSSGDKNTFIDSNIISGGHGDQSGMASNNYPIQKYTYGIYLDYMSHLVKVRHNTISDIAGSAFHFNDPDSLTLLYNTTFNITEAAVNVGVWTRPYNGANYKNNIFCVQDSAVGVYYINAITTTDLTSIGVIDSNYLIKTNSSKILTVEKGGTYTYSFNSYNFSSWNSTYLNDIHSNLKVITMDSVRLETNPTSSAKTNSLPYNYMDVKGATYNGTITLAPYSSAVLIKNGAIIITNQSPTANAGADQSITLPTSTVSLSGSGIDPDGTISSYFWTKISGPTAGTIANINSASTSVSGLVQGVYKFELKVTDHNGATGRDTMQVTVNAAVNIAPVANAGSDKSITLPTNTVSLNGNGTDADGTITNYLWTKISGPTSYNIVNASSPVTSVSGLVQGVYKFELKITDNNGATGRDTMQVTVNAAANISPTANAGADQSITLPTSTVSLAGSGTDPDGSISSYNWTKISGPSTGTITNAASSATTVTGLVQGVYQFELKAIDHNGATGRDTMQVTGNAASNISP